LKPARNEFAQQIKDQMYPPVEDIPIPAIDFIQEEKGYAHYIASHRKPNFAKYVQRRPQRIKHATSKNI
jgi:hypothetical protein